MWNPKGGAHLTLCALAAGGVAKVGARAGVTRSVAPIQVAERPPIYMVDSPGIMVPNFSAEPELGFKLSLLGKRPNPACVVARAWESDC